MSLPNVINEINTIKANYFLKSGGVLTGKCEIRTSGNDESFLLKNLNDDSAVVPTTRQARAFRIYDKNGKILGDIRFGHETTGEINTAILARYTNAEGTASNATLQLSPNSGGTAGSSYLKFNGYDVITSAGGIMSSSLRRDGVSVSWRTILDNSPQSSFLYQNTYTGYMPALNLKTKDGRVGIGTYENYLALTYFLDTNTTNSANTQLNLLSNGTATIGGKQIVCVTKWTSGVNWYRKYSDGFIEQGGTVTARDNTITFHTPFSNTNYTIIGNEIMNSPTAEYELSIVKTSSTTCRVYCDSGGSYNGKGACWYACGY
mgnify:CR=1 FL=1